MQGTGKIVASLSQKCRLANRRAFDDAKMTRVDKNTDLAAIVRKNRWTQFDATLKMLNESLHTCLR